MSATFQPTSANSRPSATSLIIGEAIRNENVTPSGTPAETKPTNSGTAEHEQNGVKMPRLAAAMLPSPSRLPARKPRVRSGEKKLRTMPMANTTSASSISTLGVSKMKKLKASSR